VAGIARRLVGHPDNQRLFPHLCAKNGKWFHCPRELFRRQRPTKQWREKLNEFSCHGVGRNPD
jgi:hypothetical protein